MAIDMIESNELSALAPSRLGLRQFADENFSNYTGSEEFYNLFGSRKAKKSAIREKVRSKYIDLPTDCLNIDASIDIISNDVTTLLKQKANIDQREALDETNIILGEFKNKSIAQGCERIKIKQQSELHRAQTLDTLTTLGDISVQKAEAELKGIQGLGQTGGLDNKKLLIYGGVGLAVIVGIVLILRR
jgi:hypothetical protein